MLRPFFRTSGTVVAPAAARASHGAAGAAASSSSSSSLWGSEIVASGHPSHSGFTAIRAVHQAQQRLILAHADGRMASYKREGTAQTFSYARSFEKHPRSVLCLSNVLQTSAGTIVSAGHSSGDVILHNADDQKPLHQFKTGFRAITSLALFPPPASASASTSSPGAVIAPLPLVVTTSSSGNLCAYDPNRMQLLSNMRPSSQVLRDLAILGPRTFLTLSGGAIRVWALKNIADRQEEDERLILQEQSCVSEEDSALSCLALVPLNEELSSAFSLSDANQPLPFKHLLATAGNQISLWRPALRLQADQSDVVDAGSDEKRRQKALGSSSPSPPASSLHVLTHHPFPLSSSPLNFKGRGRPHDRERLTRKPVATLHYEHLLSFPAELSQKSAPWKAIFFARRFLALTQVGVAAITLVDLVERSVEKLEGHAASCYGLEVCGSFEEQTFLSCSADKTVRRWFKRAVS